MNSKVFPENNSVNAKPVVNKFKYLFNPNSASLSLASTKPKPPEIHLDSILISWGLLSGKYDNQNIIITKPKAFHQLFVMLFLWLNLIKYMIGSFLDDNSDYLYIIGDATVFFKPMMKRIFIQTFYLFVTLKASITATYYCYYHYFNNGKKQFSWLYVLQLTKGVIKPEDLSLTEKSAEKLWYRIFITTIFAKYSTHSTVLLCVVLFAIMLKLFWPPIYLFPFGIVCYSITMLWFHYFVVHFYGTIFIFHQICYYLMIRFEECNNSLKKLLKTRDKIPLNRILVEHNTICQLVVEYNSFWSFSLLIDSITLPLIICFITYLGFFSSLVFWLKYSFAICALFLITCFLINFFSAAFVTSQAHKSYSLLNELYVKQNDKQLLLQLQLNQYIERLGVPKIGFWCWNIAVITKTNSFNAMCMIATYFLLYLDLSYKIN